MLIIGEVKGIWLKLQRTTGANYNNKFREGAYCVGKPNAQTPVRYISPRAILRLRTFCGSQRPQSVRLYLVKRPLKAVFRCIEGRRLHRLD